MKKKKNKFCDNNIINFTKDTILFFCYNILKLKLNINFFLSFYAIFFVIT